MDSDQASARICLLGKPALFIGSRLQPFGGSRKAIALLAYVLLHRERALSRAAVAELFWPDEDDELARASLRRHLYRALAALPEAAANRPWVIADKVTLRWNPDAQLEIDTNAYERLSAAGDRVSAVELYRGDYLEDFCDEWVLPERERLRELQSANLFSLVEERRRALDYPGAIAFAQALLRLDPLREDAIRRLMSLRFSAGDRSGALAEFESFARRLHDELAAEPMPETLALREAIRSNDLSTLERDPAAPTRNARPGFPFAGRSAALHALREAWESAARGSASAAMVSGEAGAGKSRLIAELMVLAEAQGGRVLFGSTATIESEPYQPVAEALRGALPLLRFDRLEPVKLAALSSLLPRVRELVPNVPQLPQLGPERDRQRLFDAVASTFEHLAEKRPVLVVLEDLHWAGAATIELLEFFVGRLHAKPLLLVVSFREEEVDGSHRLRQFLRRIELQHAGHVALGPLEENDVRALITGLPTDERNALAHEVFAAGEGNALFVTELLRERLGGGNAAPVPAGIAETVIERLKRLSPPARTLVDAAAVAGTAFEVEVVRHACGWSFAEVFDALDELLDRAFVRVSAQRRGDFAFSHQLVHAAVYGGVEAPLRRGLHRRIAKTLDQLFPERPSLCASVARHFDAAGFGDEAVARYLPAARYALDVFAQAEAIELASRALELCSDARTRFELHSLREEAAARAGDVSTRSADCTSMRELAGALGDDDLIGSALCRTIEMLSQRAELAGQIHFIGELHELGRRLGSRRWAVEAALAQARLHAARAAYAAVRTVLGDIEPLVAGLDDALLFEYWYLCASTSAIDAPERTRVALARARLYEGGARMRKARLLRVEANLAYWQDDAAGLLRAGTQLLALYLEVGDLEGQALAHLHLAASAVGRLEVAAHREHIGHALALSQRVQKPQLIATVISRRANFEFRLGNFAAAERDHLEARSLSEWAGRCGSSCSSQVNLALVASYRGDQAGARALALDALSYALDHGLERERYHALEQLGRAERELGLLEPARLHLEDALRRAREHEPGKIADTLAELIQLYILTKQGPESLALATELLACIEENRGATTFPAHAIHVAAAAYAADGQHEKAAALHFRARTLLQQLASRIEDGPARQGYLSLCVHRDIAMPDNVSTPIP
jgi:DNA-binding SARP family transcriptional activator